MTKRIDPYELVRILHDKHVTLAYITLLLAIYKEATP